MKKFISLALVLTLCLGLCACSGSKLEGKGYDSPEEALIAYAQALQSGDMDKILATFAIETYVNHFDLEESIASVHAFFPSVYFLPNSNEEVYDFNISQREAVITKNIHLMYISLTLDEDASLPVSLHSGPYEDAEEIVDDLSAKEWPFADMDFDEDFIYLEDLIDGDILDKTEERLKNHCDIYGCDEIVPLMLEVEIGGEDYLLWMDVARYGEKWYCLNQGGYISSILGAPSTSGGLGKKED